MKNNRLPFVTVLLFVVLLAIGTAAPVLAQDEGEEDDEGLGHLFAEIEAWVAQPSGLEYFPATQIDPANPFDTQLLNFEHSTETEFRYRAGYDFGTNWGALVLTWYAHNETEMRTGVRPGDFVFGETLAPPLYAGFGNDGLADAFDATADTLLRDFRIDYYRTAFKTPRVSAKWFVGWHRVKHERQIDADYLALVPDLPPLIPPFVDPRPDLDPGVDSVNIASRFEGRGVGAGMDFLAPFWKDKLSLEGGFRLAALRGETDTAYSATTHYYVFIDPDDSSETILTLPYDEFDATQPDGTPIVNNIEQRNMDFGLNADGYSSTAQVLEAYVGFRWKAWRDLEVFGGIRNTRYTDIGVDLRPKVTSNTAGLNVQDVTEINHSATYEGFYGGIAYRF